MSKKVCIINDCKYRARTHGEYKCLLMLYHFEDMDEYLDEKYGKVDDVPEGCPYVLEFVLKGDKEEE
jgi:hypothetical protein